MTRRDKCYLVGKRASLLGRREAATAWSILATHLAVVLSDQDMPKFRDLLRGIRRATIDARRPKK